MHPHKPHATSQPSRFSHTPRLSTDSVEGTPLARCSQTYVSLCNLGDFKPHYVVAVASWSGITFGDTAVDSACSLCQGHVFTLRPVFGSAPRAQATREHRWRHMKHLLLNARAFRAWATLWRLLSSGMTSSGRMPAPHRPRRCCRLHFHVIVSPSWLPRLVLSRSSLTLLPPLASMPLGTQSCSVRFMLRSCCMHPALRAPASPYSPRRWRGFVFLPGPLSRRACSGCGAAACACSCSALVRPCA